MEKFKLKKHRYLTSVSSYFIFIVIWLAFWVFDWEGNKIIWIIAMAATTLLYSVIMLIRLIEYLFYRLALKKGDEYVGVIDKALDGRDRDAGRFVTFKIVYKRNEKYKYKWTRLYERNEYESYICGHCDISRFTCKLYRYMGIMVLDKESIEEDEYWNYKKHGWGI